MAGNNPQIILERRAGRQLMGCLAAVVIFGCLVCLAIQPDAVVEILGFFGIMLALVLFSKRHDHSKKRNIILTPQGIQFSEGGEFASIVDIFQSEKYYNPASIPWNELGEVKHLKKVSRNRTDNGTIESVYNSLELKKQGDLSHTNPSTIYYCNDLGRQVLNSQTSFTAERAVALIEKLRDADSGEERIQILKNTYVGKSPGEIKRQIRNTPWKQRLTRYCPACKLTIFVDGRKEQSEQRCHSCGGNEIYKDEDEYLKTLDKKA